MRQAERRAPTVADGAPAPHNGIPAPHDGIPAPHDGVPALADSIAPGDDAAIIELSWREPERFAVLFDRHAPRIHRYAARRIGREAADDLVAETFLAAFAKRRRYDSAYRDAGPWLYGIATNLVGQHRRDEARQFRIRQAAIPDLDVPGHDERVAADVTASSVHGLLAAALAGLAGGDRDVVVLIAWEQLTYEETARALAIPVGTVRSRLNRARASLRHALAGTDRSDTFEEILSNE
jgi:RNA polymerase sigma factor (sigma-70 family)